MIEKPKIIKEQLDFYGKGLAGCKFAEYVAQRPDYHKWGHSIIEDVNVDNLDKEVERVIKDPNINQISLILPGIKTKEDLEFLLKILEKSNIFFFEPEEEYNNYRCIKLRAKVLEKTAWVSGFAPMDFLPKTRQAPYTELVLRVKDKPDYKKSVQPPTPENELHVANLEVADMSREEFTKTWQESFTGTKKILGHPADELSAAKTTFAIPK